MRSPRPLPDRLLEEALHRRAARVRALWVDPTLGARIEAEVRTRPRGAAALPSRVLPTAAAVAAAAALAIAGALDPSPPHAAEHAAVCPAALEAQVPVPPPSPTAPAPAAATTTETTP